MKNRRFLTPRFFAVYGIIQLLGIASGVIHQFLWAWAILTPLILIDMVLDFRRLPNESDYKLGLIIPADLRIDQDRTMSCHVQFKSTAAVRISELEVQAPKTSLFHFENPHESLWPQRDANQDVTFRFHVYQLGFVRIERLKLTVRSNRRYFTREFWIDIEPIETRVSPRQVDLSEQAFQQLIQAQRTLSLGARLQTRARAADQFHSVRAYQFPDPLKHIDQKKTARYGKPMTRVFDSQFNHHLVLVLDTGRAMQGEIAGSRKVDYYISAALNLARNAIGARDKVSLISFSQSIRSFVRGARSQAAFLSLYRGDIAFSPVDEESDYRNLPAMISQVASTRSIVVVLTDAAKPSVRENLLQALTPVSRKHLTVVLSLVDRAVDLEAQVLSSEARDEASYKKDLKKFREWYSDLLYSYWTHERQRVFSEQLARQGAGALAVNDVDWLAAVDKLYGLLRSSQRA